MSNRYNIADWFGAMHDHAGPKIVTGRRGIGKSAQLVEFADRLKAFGVPKSKILFLDGESAQTYRFLSSERTIDYIVRQCPRPNDAYVLIREASAFPDVETTLGILSALPRFNVFVTASSRHMLTVGLEKYLEGRFALYECLPPLQEEPTTDIRRIWNEALLCDVRTPIRQPFNAHILNSLACHLSDNIGSPHSLRSLSAAISPASALMSPHTIDSYLTALGDAYLIEKCLRYDLAEEGILKNQFRCYFTTPAMRTEIFGPAPTDEPRRARLNAAWFKLRHASDEVFTASSAPKYVDFVTRHGDDYRLWHAGEDKLVEVSRDSFVAGRTC